MSDSNIGASALQSLWGGRIEIVKIVMPLALLDMLRLLTTVYTTNGDDSITVLNGVEGNQTMGGPETLRMPPRYGSL